MKNPSDMQYRKDKNSKYWPLTYLIIRNICIFALMKINLETFEGIDRPIYVLEEERLRRNLQLISDVAHEANVEIILAFKAYSLWKTFPIFREYIKSTTASSLYEARLAFEEFGCKAHTYSPAYTDYEIDKITDYSSHLSFNSLSQYTHYYNIVRGRVSIGLRINPEYSEVGTELYNPCAPGTRFGVTADKLPTKLLNVHFNISRISLQIGFHS